MGVILDFPHPDKAREDDVVDTFIRKVSDKIGLTEEETTAVISSYRSVHPSLTEKFESPMEIPADVNLDERQIGIINEALKEHMSDLFAFSASIIIGLLAREQVNNRQP